MSLFVNQGDGSARVDLSVLQRFQQQNEGQETSRGQQFLSGDKILSVNDKNRDGTPDQVVLSNQAGWTAFAANFDASGDVQSVYLDDGKFQVPDHREARNLNRYLKDDFQSITTLEPDEYALSPQVEDSTEQEDSELSDLLSTPGVAEALFWGFR